MRKTATAVMIGDIVGPGGIRALFSSLPVIRKEFRADIVVVNGENAAGGFGLTPEILAQFLSMGVDAVTSGNHIWQKREILEELESNPRLLRPANYPPGAPGKGYALIEAGGLRWAVVNLQGREDLYPIDCPFRAGKDLMKRARQDKAIPLVDFHAESTEEKEALAFHLDGEAAFIAGTHTHVQTSDLRILPGGTGYVTDLGMTGPVDSCIGVKREISIGRVLTQIPLKMEVAETDAVVRGIVARIDIETMRTVEVEYLPYL